MQNILSTSKMKRRKKKLLGKIIHDELFSGFWLLFATRASRVLWKEWVMKSKKFALKIMIWLDFGVLMVLENQFKKSFGTLSFLQKSLLVSYKVICVLTAFQIFVEINLPEWINSDH